MKVLDKIKEHFGQWFEVQEIDDISIFFDDALISVFENDNIILVHFSEICPPDLSASVVIDLFAYDYKVHIGPSFIIDEDIIFDDVYEVTDRKIEFKLKGEE